MDEIVAINTKCCVMCHQSHTLYALKSEVDKYLHGAKVQHAFPNMPASDREMIISGTCPPCFNMLFPPEDE